MFIPLFTVVFDVLNYQKTFKWVHAGPSVMSTIFRGVLVDFQYKLQCKKCQIWFFQFCEKIACYQMFYSYLWTQGNPNMQFEKTRFCLFVQILSLFDLIDNGKNIIFNGTKSTNYSVKICVNASQNFVAIKIYLTFLCFC